MQRIVVVGTSGAGKTTMARNLAAALGIPHVELDALHWEPNWTEAAPEVMAARVEQAVAAGRWVVDGNYGSIRHLIWPRADTVVWMDFSFPRVFGQVLVRTLRRSFTGAELWQGNRESLYMSFLTRDSILLWVLQTYHRRRREIPQLLRRPEYAHLQLIRLRSPAQAARFLAGLGHGVA